MIKKNRVDAKPRHSLRQFQPDRTAPDHRERRGQILHLEHALVGEGKLAEALERLGNTRIRSGRDHNCLGAYRVAVVEGKRVLTCEMRACLNTGPSRQSVERCTRCFHKFVTLAADAF